MARQTDRPDESQMKSDLNVVLFFTGLAEV